MDWLFGRPSPSEANHWLAILSLALFALGIIASSFLSTRPGLPPFNSRQTQKFVMRACTIVGWICGIGLFFGVIRFLQIDPITIGRGFWIALSWVALAVAIALLVMVAPADREVRRANDERLRHRQGLKPSRRRVASHR